MSDMYGAVRSNEFTVKNVEAFRTWFDGYIFGEQTLPDPDEEILRSNDIDVRIVASAGHDMMSDNPDGFALVVADSMLSSS